MPRPFVGLIVVPFVGNVAEHFSAVRLAYRNRVDFSMGIAYGSGIQVALVASAVAVFAGALMGHNLTLVFDPLELAALAAAAVGASLIARGGETNWLEGLQLAHDLPGGGRRRLAAVNTGARPRIIHSPDRVEAAVQRREHLGGHECRRDGGARLVVEGAVWELAGNQPRSGALVAKAAGVPGLDHPRGRLAVGGRAGEQRRSRARRPGWRAR